MPYIKIINSADERKVAGSLNGEEFCIPRDGKFHPIKKELLPALDDSDVEYEIRQPQPKKAAAGAAVGHGGQAAAPSDPLDHDGDGKRGGSKRGKLSTRAKGAAKRAMTRLKDIARA